MFRYGQFCPVAKALEVLGERWSILVVRELLLGNTQFNQLHRALPRISPTTLKIVGRSAYLKNLREWFPLHMLSGIRPASSR